MSISHNTYTSQVWLIRIYNAYTRPGKDFPLNLYSNNHEEISHLKDLILKGLNYTYEKVPHNS